MLIEVENTPNPATRKFLPGRTIAPDGAVEFQNDTFQHGDHTRFPPLVYDLFATDYVRSVLIGPDFIAITITQDPAEWSDLAPHILSLLGDHLADGGLLDLQHDAPQIEDESDVQDDPADADIVAQIRELLDTRIRPAVANDGGDIVYRGFRDGTVYLRMKGACSGCPSSTATLQHGVTNLLRHYIPEVIEVRAI